MWNVEAEMCEKPPKSIVQGVVFTTASFLPEVNTLVNREKSQIIVIGHPTELKEIEVGKKIFGGKNNEKVDIDGFLGKPIRQTKVLEFLMKSTTPIKFIKQKSMGELRATSSPIVSIKYLFLAPFMC